MTASLSWDFAPQRWNISDDAVHVYSISLNGRGSMLPELFSLLSADETQRASRFHFEKDRIRFIIARGFLRKILAGHLRKDPRSIDFLYGKNGKPQLALARDLRFNLSHSGDLALCAITRSGEVGIDVEKIEPIHEMDEMARRFFFDEELKAFQQSSPKTRERIFYRFWTHGEALLKWYGSGLVEPGERWQMTKIFKGAFLEFTPAPGFLGAIAVSKPGTKISMWQWPVDGMNSQEVGGPLKLLPKNRRDFIAL